jgi:hypothetical protein
MMSSYFYAISIQGTLRESGNVGADDIGVSPESDLGEVANAIVARRRNEAAPWDPFTGDQIEVWGPVDSTGGARPPGPPGHVQSIAEV